VTFISVLALLLDDVANCSELYDCLLTEFTKGLGNRAWDSGKKEFGNRAWAYDAPQLARDLTSLKSAAFPDIEV
jgi:hypothetical protein